MRRREFIAGLGGAAALPLAARAQQSAAQPIIGFLRSSPFESNPRTAAAFQRGLREPDMSRVKTSRSNTAMRTINSIDCQP
jgi:hypothetical protein